MMGIEIDWTLIVLIGILVCLVHMAISLVDLRAGNRMDMDTLYKETSTINKTIKDEIGGVKIVMRELGTQKKVRELHGPPSVMEDTTFDIYSFELMSYSR